MNKHNFIDGEILYAQPLNEMDDEILNHCDEIDALEKETKDLSLKVKSIWQSYDESTITSYTREVNVPNALSLASLDMVGGMSHKSPNLFQFDRYTASPSGQITITNNNDGTFTLNGTATSQVVIYFYLKNSDSLPNSYKALGVPNPSNNTYYATYNRGGGWIQAWDYTGNGNILTEKITSYVVVVTEGTTISNVVVKPMITTNTSLTYADFEPYSTDIVNSEIDIKAIGTNLLNPTLQSTTLNGVTCTNNGDGTYTLNGTPTSNTAFLLGTFAEIGSFKLVGCPANGGFNKYLLYIGASYGAKLVEDAGNGGTFTNSGTNNVNILVFSGQTYSNMLFRPMITLDTSATYNSFRPYHAPLPHPLPESLKSLPWIGINNSVYNYLEFKDNKWLWHERCGESTLDGSTWTQSSYSSAYIWCSTRALDIKLNGAFINSGAFGDYPHDEAGFTNTITSVYVNDFGLSVITNEYATLDNFKAYINANPMHIIYELVSERVTDVTDLIPEDWDILEVEANGQIEFANIDVPSRVTYVLKLRG